MLKAETTTPRTSEDTSLPKTLATIRRKTKTKHKTTDRPRVDFQNSIIIELSHEELC